MENIESIILGGGCFWCIEEIYNQLNGVKMLYLVMQEDLSLS